MATAAASGRLTRSRCHHLAANLTRMRLRGSVQPRPGWLIPAAITVVAALFRLGPWLAVHPLHHDEALYGTWARLITSGQDPLLLTPWIDKPPLSIYLIAASFRLFGVSEAALRLPGMLASLVTLWATYGLAQHILVRRGALWAAALLAISPFAILFAPTAFTDPWLTLWLVAAAWAALAERPLLAGLAAGLAVASKQQGVFAIPLILALMIGRRSNAKRAVLQIALAGLGFVSVFGPLTWWDSLRWHNRPSFWERSLNTYGGLGLAAAGEWPGRAAEWVEPLGYLFGLPLFSAAVVGLAAWAGLAALFKDASDGRKQPADRTRATAILGLYVTGYMLVHVIVTFQPWDRYLLPILPLLCVLAVQGAGWTGRNPADCGTGKEDCDTDSVGGRLGRGLAGVVLAGAMCYAAWLGAGGRIPVGSDYGAYRGIDRAAAALTALPADAVIYHQSLGWHLDFYLFDAPQERRWYDTAEKLAADASRTIEAEPARPQWLVLPAWETPTEEDLRAPLAAQGLRLMAAQVIELPGGGRAFTLYRVTPDTAQEGR